MYKCLRNGIQINFLEKKREVEYFKQIFLNFHNPNNIIEAFKQRDIATI